MAGDGQTGSLTGDELEVVAGEMLTAPVPILCTPLSPWSISLAVPKNRPPLLCTQTWRSPKPLKVQSMLPLNRTLKAPAGIVSRVGLPAEGVPEDRHINGGQPHLQMVDLAAVVAATVLVRRPST